MASGRDAVWTALVDQRDRATRVALSRCSNRDEVDDCVQEAMARVAAMPDVDVCRVGPLLTAVVGNLAVDGYRARGRAQRHQHRIAAPPEPTPEDDVCDAAEARWLWAQRRALPDQDRRALELRAAGHALPEVARELGITYKAAERALSRARLRLRAAARATAAFLGLLWGARPRRVASVAAVPTAVLAFAVAVAVGPASGLGSAETEVPPQTLDYYRVQHTAEQVRAAPSQSSQQPAPRPTAREVPRGARRVPTAEALRAGPVRVGPAPTTRHNGEESAVETLTRCLERGPVVTTTYIGCPG